MKRFSAFLVAGLLSLSSFAADFETHMTEGKAAFEQRSPGNQFAQQAADAFSLAAQNATSELEKAQALNAKSEAVFFVADHLSTDKEKELKHEEGWKTALEAISTLQADGQPGQAKDPEFEEDLCVAYYWYGANRGKWGEARGVLQSLTHWPDLQKHMEYIIKLGYADVVSYGANRILGRAYYKLPFPLGNKQKSLDLLKEAHDQTIEGEPSGISRYSINVVYYAETLIALDKKEEAKKILDALISKGQSEDALRAYNPDRIPETKEDIEEAKRIRQRL